MLKLFLMSISICSQVKDIGRKYILTQVCKYRMNLPVVHYIFIYILHNSEIFTISSKSSVLGIRNKDRGIEAIHRGHSKIHSHN